MTHEERLGAAKALPWRPGWEEVSIGGAVTAIIGFGLGSQLQWLGFDPTAYGLVLAGWSGLACFLGFAAAWRLRRRALSAFGLRPTTRQWLLLAVGVGVITFIAKGIAVLAFTALTGIGHSPQGVYAAGGSGGIVSLIAATFLIGVVVPIGEEFLFRGVLTTALLRYRPFIAVIGSALVFALLHGISIVFPAAIVLGLVAGEIYRRSGSIWPGVVVHMVYNLPTVPMMVLAARTA
jgi:membrane protease YdiL (CAAX protease family)